MTEPSWPAWGGGEGGGGGGWVSGTDGWGGVLTREASRGVLRARPRAGSTRLPRFHPACAPLVPSSPALFSFPRQPRGPSIDESPPPPRSPLPPGVTPQPKVYYASRSPSSGARCHGDARARALNCLARLRPATERQMVPSGWGFPPGPFGLSIFLRGPERRPGAPPRRGGRRECGDPAHPLNSEHRLVGRGSGGAGCRGIQSRLSPPPALPLNLLSRLQFCRKAVPLPNLVGPRG